MYHIIQHCFTSRHIYDFLFLEPDFKWEGAGQQLFNAKPNKNSGDKSKNESGVDDDAVAEEEYDPHYEPIVPLPEKIVVTTGEEDEVSATMIYLLRNTNIILQ